MLGVWCVVWCMVYSRRCVVCGVTVAGFACGTMPTFSICSSAPSLTAPGCIDLRRIEVYMLPRELIRACAPLITSHAFPRYKGGTARSRNVSEKQRGWANGQRTRGSGMPFCTLRVSSRVCFFGRVLRDSGFNVSQFSPRIYES